MSSKPKANTTNVGNYYDTVSNGTVTNTMPQNKDQMTVTSDHALFWIARDWRLITCCIASYVIGSNFPS